MSETDTTLRFVVPLDLARPEDRALFEAFQAVSNGLNGSVARLLMQRSLPKNADGIDALLIEAVRDQAARKRLRGRPVGSGTRRGQGALGAASSSILGSEAPSPPIVTNGRGLPPPASDAATDPPCELPADAGQVASMAAVVAAADPVRPLSTTTRADERAPTVTSKDEKVSGPEYSGSNGSDAVQKQGDVKANLSGLVAWN
ncbi:hypothetical protein [Burkholderia ubonensis]|uniref:hypothetical protein n=1 Tax=Burkholderia ubonensis TaxID=101571 RepID=UPI0009B3CE30|nr:hypothetical protein [Burkholderia ubonensis]